MPSRCEYDFRKCSVKPNVPIPRFVAIAWTETAESGVMHFDGTLVIGANLHNHGRSSFCVDVTNERVVGMNTERFTRYKHDGAASVPAIRELITLWHISDPVSVRRVILATSLLNQFDWQLSSVTCDEVVAMQQQLGARYKEEIRAALAATQSEAMVPLRDFASACLRAFQLVFPTFIELVPHDHHLTHAITGLDTPDDALDDFLESRMDFLVVADLLVRRA